MGVLIWRGLVTHKFSVPPSGETMRQTPKSFRGARTCSRSSITMPSLVGIGFHPPPGRRKTLSFLFVCPSVTLLNVRVCAPDKSHFTFMVFVIHAGCPVCGPEIIPFPYPFTSPPFTLSFTFPFLFASSIYLLFHPFPFYQNSPTPFPGRMYILGGD